MTKDETSELQNGGFVQGSNKSLAMSMPNIAKFSLNRKR
jgi:hypothetical protein